MVVVVVAEQHALSSSRPCVCKLKRMGKDVGLDPSGMDLVCVNRNRRHVAGFFVVLPGDIAQAVRHFIGRLHWRWCVLAVQKFQSGIFRRQRQQQFT